MCTVAGAAAFADDTVLEGAAGATDAIMFAEGVADADTFIMDEVNIINAFLATLYTKYHQSVL